MSKKINRNTEKASKHLKLKLIKAKKKFERAQAKYDNLRQLVADDMEQHKFRRSTAQYDDEMFIFNRGQSARIPKASVEVIRGSISKKQFAGLFSTSYQISLSKYNALPDGKLKDIIKAYVTIVDTPLSIKNKVV